LSDEPLILSERTTEKLNKKDLFTGKRSEAKFFEEQAERSGAEFVPHFIVLLK